MKIVKKIKKTGNLTLFGEINDYPCFAPGALAESPIKHDTGVTPSLVVPAARLFRGLLLVFTFIASYNANTHRTTE